MSTTSPAVLRATTILGLLSRTPTEPLSISEIARQIEVPKSTTATICAALLEAGLLQQHGAKLGLGRKLVELGGAYLQGVEPLTDLRAFCRSLPYASRETVRIAVLDGLDVVYLFVATGQRSLRIAAGVGDRAFAPHTATGKAMLAKLSDNELDTLLKNQTRFPAATASSIRTADELRSAIAEVRALGYAVDDEESYEGIYCLSVAAETKGSAENRLMAVSATMLKAVVDDTVRQELLHDLSAIADNLTQPLASRTMEALTA